MMLITVILVTSLILQCLAVYLVFRLIRVSGKSLAWRFIVAAITLMALQRGVSLGQLFFSDMGYRADWLVELVTLIISALLVFGLQRITPVIAGLRASAERQNESLIRYRTIFENSPISIWEEDFSAIKETFDRLRRAGVTDIASYVEQHPEIVRQCAEEVKIVDVNRAALTLHGAASKEELLAGLVNTFTPESFDTFRAELICLWCGDTEMKSDAVVKTLQGEPRHVTVEYAVCPGFEESLSKVFVSLVDVTRRKETELQLKQALELTEGVINAIPDILIEVNGEGRYLNVWTWRPDALVAPKEELLGRTVNEMLPPDAAALAMSWIREADEKGFSLNNLMRLDLPDGTRWFDHSISKKPSDDPSAESRFLVLSREVTERMRMEEALRASEQRFRAIFDQSFQLIGLLTTEGIILETNRAGLQFAGIEEGEVIGKPFWETPWWSHSEELQRRLREAVREAADGQFVRFEVTHPDREGRIHYVDFSLKPVTDSTGRVIQLIPEGRDITERKLAEQERQLLADRLTNLDRINRVIQGAGDLETMMKNVLDEVLAILACERAFLVYPCDPAAASWSLQMERTRPEYPEAEDLNMALPMDDDMARTLDLLLQARGTLTFGPGSERPLPAEASERYGCKSLMSIALYPKVGKPWLFGIQQCSSERIWTETEERLLEEIGQRLTDGLTSLLVLRDLRTRERQLIEAQHLAHLGNWELDLIENRLVWSEEIYRIFEVDKGQFEATYEAFLDVVHPDDREGVDSFYSGALKKHGPHETVHRLLMKDGRVKYVNEQCETFYDVSEKPLRSIGTMQDITEQKEKEDELRHYRDHLEDEVRQRTEELRLACDAADAANMAKSAFLANMSHELRTPLNAILGFSHILQQDSGLDEKQHETLHIINNSGEHLLRLINDVLEIAKIEAGKLQLEISSFDLHSLVREVTDMMRLRAQQKGLQLDLDQSSQFPRYIKGDEARLRQILVNLVSNAVKFTHEGGVIIRLGVKENAQHHLTLEVQDSGPGISEEDQQRLFQPFVQLSDGDLQTGTGLGLSIVKQFVHLMGGVISIESTLGMGSLFHVELPLHAADEESVSHLTEARHSNVVGLAPGQSVYRILVAEDQRNNQLLLVKLMSDIGLEVKVAENGKECLRLFKDWRPHLILMDRRMPLMDGVEATKRIRQLPGGKQVKIVAVTASAFKEQKEELLAAGMDDFVRKPYKIDEIYQCLANQLGIVYRYQHEQVGKAASATLTPVMLAGLDDTLKSQLREALDLLDSVRIAAAIQRIDAQDHVLASLLKSLADNFDYPSIMMALKVSSEERKDD